MRNCPWSYLICNMRHAWIAWVVHNWLIMGSNFAGIWGTWKNYISCIGEWFHCVGGHYLILIHCICCWYHHNLYLFCKFSKNLTSLTFLGNLDGLEKLSIDGMLNTPYYKSTPVVTDSVLATISGEMRYVSIYLMKLSLDHYCFWFLNAITQQFTLLTFIFSLCDMQLTPTFGHRHTTGCIRHRSLAHRRHATSRIFRVGTRSGGKLYGQRPQGSMQ